MHLKSAAIRRLTISRWAGSDDQPDTDGYCSDAEAEPTLIAPASRKLEEEAREQTFVTAVIVHDGLNPINSTVLLEPLWARSTHIMTFRAVMLDRLDHWAFSFQ
jgi:hypothetical protein